MRVVREASRLVAEPTSMVGAGEQPVDALFFDEPRETGSRLDRWMALQSLDADANERSTSWIPPRSICA